MKKLIFLPILCFILASSGFSGTQVLNYTIKKQDSLLELCGIFKVSEKELLEYNDESKLTRFWEGDQIKIPLKKIKIVSHKIKKGDTLFDLIKHYKTDVEAIYSINPESILEKMRVGKTILIPISLSSHENNFKTKPDLEKSPSGQRKYQVKKGESYYSIGQKIGISYEILEKMNGKKTLYPGDMIIIPKEDLFFSEPSKCQKIESSVSVPSLVYKIASDTQIKSPYEGEIVGIRPLQGYGRAIFIKSSKGTIILASKGFENLLVSFGKSVTKGQTLGNIRKDYCLHFFLAYQNQLIDPKKYIH